MKTFLTLFLYSFLLLGCNFNTTKENREQDRIEAEKVTEKFYSLLRENNREDVYKLFGNKFFKVSDKEWLNKTIDWTYNEAGGISERSLVEWETTIVKGTNPSTDYFLIYDVKRNKINTEEIFSLQKEGGSIKIQGYKINLDIQTK